MSALFLQGLGAIAYLVFPALGPFLYQQGASPIATKTQSFMLHIHDLSAAGGAQWLSVNGSANLLAGLGAMPSLHAGGSFLFLWFAFRHARILLPTYIPLFCFIMITAIANRWHYLIDLPVGISLACLSIRLAGHFEQRATAHAPEAACRLPEMDGWPTSNDVPADVRQTKSMTRGRPGTKGPMRRGGKSTIAAT